MPESPRVVFQERTAANNKVIAFATLNAEKSLNALNLEMIDLLQAKLSEWEQRPEVVCVVLQGAGEKAFCAGGDVIALHDNAAAYGEELPSYYCQHFFSREYRLDYHIHCYPKPILVWGNGIVMGGGLGLMAGASHRVVTEHTHMAMPEINIGLFPDVGGTWFLNHAPGKTGLFAGLTAATLNGSDALFVGLGDYFIGHHYRELVLEKLAVLDWSDNPSDGKQALAFNNNHQLVSRLLREHVQESKPLRPTSNVSTHFEWINEVADGYSLLDIIERISSYEGEDAWLSKAVRTLNRGCPVTPHLVFQQMLRGRHLSLADVFRMELAMSVNCARFGHFKEGVRALLVDKDRTPKWKPASFAEVDQAHIDEFFIGPWSDHPLGDLGSSG